MPADDGQHQQVQQDAHSPQGGVPVAVLADLHFRIGVVPVAVASCMAAVGQQRRGGHGSLGKGNQDFILGIKAFDPYE